VHEMNSFSTVGKAPQGSLKVAMRHSPGIIA
jgi:hypothetical protein